MNQHRLSSLAHSALTIAALALASGPAWAQHGGGLAGLTLPEKVAEKLNKKRPVVYCRS